MSPLVQRDNLVVMAEEERGNGEPFELVGRQGCVRVRGVQPRVLRLPVRHASQGRRCAAGRIGYGRVKRRISWAMRSGTSN